MLRLHQISLERLKGYVLAKLGGDGGYLSYQYMNIFDSTAEDTFYALSILTDIGCKPPRPGKIKRFLKGQQLANGEYRSLSVAYYSVKALAILGDKPERTGRAIDYLLRGLKTALSRKPIEKAISVEEEHFMASGVLKSFDATSALTPVEIPPVLRDIAASLDALKTLNVASCGLEGRVIERVMEFRAGNGFGVGGPDLASTYYALKALRLAGYRVSWLGHVKEWVKLCENPQGGFDVKPGARTPFTEYLYYGTGCLAMLGFRARYEMRHLKLLAACQNGDGGFSRAPGIGLTTLQSSYYVIKAVKQLGFLP